MTQEQKDQDQLGMWGSIERLEMRLNTLRARLANMQEHCPWCRAEYAKRPQGDNLGIPAKQSCPYLDPHGHVPVNFYCQYQCDPAVGRRGCESQEPVEGIGE